jgi:hypothetical protein
MDLIREFDRAGLRLELTGAPIVDADRNIFQMDISRARGREQYRMWTGAETNRVRVTDVDRFRRQLVLLVQEGERMFVELVSKRSLTRDEVKARMGRGARLVRETRDNWIVERVTTSALRRFLCGMDERHLFIAQVEGGTTVRDAHRLLKPEVVRDAERSHAGRLLRQGEWFFVPLNRVEQRTLAVELEVRPWIVRKGESLGGNGHPHEAEESVWMDAGQVYARGAIRHRDHRTLVLPDWRRVHLNAEVRQSAVGTSGIYWID